ncbi:hypothetical protein BH10BDE1_BH10BDE1_23070 [soil metagenome]
MFDLSLNSAAIDFSSISMMQIFSAIGIAIVAQFHCAAMCGPFVGQYAKRPRDFVFSQGGRILAYTTIGGIAATVGGRLRPHPMATIIFCVVIFVFAIIGILRIFGLAKFMLPKTRISFRVISFLERRLQRFSTVRAFALGLATPLIPCGQLWIVMGFAGLTNSSLMGATTGFIFGLGTVPGIYAFTWIRNRLSRLDRPLSRRLQTVFSATLLAALALSASMSLAAARRGIGTSQTPASESVPPRCH